MASSRTQAKIRKWKDQASKALRKGRAGDALEAYRALEKLEPAEGLWPQRAADVHRREGDAPAAIEALERAADRWADGGFLLKAIATCKMVLELDPAHTRIQEQLTELYASRGHSPSSAEDAEQGGGSGLERGRPLEEIVLTEVVPTEDASDLRPSEESGAFAEVPLDWDHSGWLAGEDGELPPELDVGPIESVAPEDGSAAASVPVDARAAARQTLPQVPLFSALRAPALRQLIDGVQLVTLREGEALFEEGDLGDALYVVTEGAVVPVARAENGQEKRLAVLDEGAFFGETAILANQPRNARIEALVESKLLAIDRGVMSDLLDGDRELLGRMLGFFRDRLIDRLVRTSRFFSPLPAGSRRQLARSFRFLEVEAGSELIQQGATAPALYVVLAGDVEVTMRNEQGAETALAQLRAGHVFGEMSILSGDAAVASCITRRKCWLLALGRKAVVTLMAQHGPVHEAAMALATERERENARNLRSDEARPAYDVDLDLI